MYLTEGTFDQSGRVSDCEADRVGTYVQCFCDVFYGWIWWSKNSDVWICGTEQAIL
jgi:hypothetical protein